MQRQWLRVSCVLVMVVAVVVSVYHVVTLENENTRERLAAATFESLAWTLTTSLADLRISQHAYVGVGQDLDPWLERAEVRTQEIDRTLARLEELSTTAGGLEALSDTRSSFDRLRRVDEVARGHASGGQALMASDLVFADSRDLARRVGAHLELARTVERDARALQQDARRQTQAIAVGSGLAITLLIALLLFPSSAKPSSSGAVGDNLSDAEADDPTRPAAEPAAPHHDDEPSRNIDFDVDIGGVPAAPRPAAVESATAPTPTGPDLRLAAEICTDLGRLSDGNHLASILARAGLVLGASGLVLWVRDESGVALRAATGYGYTVHQLSHLGRVSCDSNNVTAAAYRTARLQTAGGGKDAPGAVAAPLLAPSDASSTTAESIGVLSVEVTRGSEASEAVQATVSILAAQLATLVSADPIAVSDSNDFMMDAGDTHAVG